MQNFFGFNIFLVSLFVFVLPLLFSIGLSSGLINIVLTTGLFKFDSLSFYLLLLVFFLGVLSLFSVVSCGLDLGTVVFLNSSLVFSGLCFCVNHSILFWCFYELSMLPLLYLIFRDSPYSERFIAGWYFCVYLLITSLPLILILLYLSYINNSFYFSDWVPETGYFFTYLLLSFIFFTKVPLCPFHTWLPIVHAEATSIVSIFLSGYIMKLGLLGVYRCSPFIFNSNMVIYLFLCCVVSVFFALTASGELDGKRWLAFLSLSHIVVPFLGFYVCSWEEVSLNFLFCLGHGLSAGLVFGFLWFFYESVNSRNWLLLKSGVVGKVSLLIVILGFLSLCSFPPTIQFFCEVFLLTQSTISYFYSMFWCFYLFLGGLVPLVLCGHLLIRSECIEDSSYTVHNFLFYFFYLIFWCYLGVFFI
uniref:NADH-ubiquinone oxidoreductase chain 4 n=1 Tax=Dollfusiella sp. MZUSP 7992 TaxID=2899499 RepID=A0A8K1SXQ8_9CEST|nr:NADH dehydrogenase subunit 4 [Dollfusiella sp. MZUSP 7992]